MTITATDLRTRIRYILHFALTEIRQLGYEQGSHARIADLADVLEYLPRFLGEDREPDYEVIREQFEKYARRYPESYGQRYVELLDGQRPTPDHY